jgi:hypothetical protein
MKNVNRINGLWLGSWILLACEEPLEPAQRIDEPRLLGVRVSTERGEASLVPGEPARVEFLLASPEGPLAARIAYRWCEAAGSARGVPYCAEEPWAEGVTDADANALSVLVPATLRPNTRLALLGAACVRGEPILAERPLNDHCSGASPPLRFSFDAWTLGDDLHPNPDLSGLLVGVEGDTIELRDAGNAPSCDGATRTLAADQEYAFEIELGAAALAAKPLQISHFSTQGQFARQYSFVNPQQPPRVSLTWQAPATAGPVKQYLVVRDGAGGVSWATWNVCVH